MIIFSPGLYCCHHPLYPLPEAAQDVAEVLEEQGKGQGGRRWRRRMWTKRSRVLNKRYFVISDKISLTSLICLLWSTSPTYYIYKILSKSQLNHNSTKHNLTFLPNIFRFRVVASLIYSLSWSILLFTASKSWDSQKGKQTPGEGRHCEGEVHNVASHDILVE